jgi:hypothetical protein
MGCGPIGQQVVAILAERSGFELVGAIDIDPEKEGQDLGLLSGTRQLGVEISSDPQSILALDAEIVILTTSSALTALQPQLELCIKAGKSVISTCEELAFPFDTQPDLADSIDRLAKDHQVAVLGTGVNPGFLMDALAVFLTSVCRSV